jgi:hypothetical protein
MAKKYWQGTNDGDLLTPGNVCLANGTPSTFVSGVDSLAFDTTAHPITNPLATCTVPTSVSTIAVEGGGSGGGAISVDGMVITGAVTATGVSGEFLAGGEFQGDVTLIDINGILTGNISFGGTNLLTYTTPSGAWTSNGQNSTGTVVVTASITSAGFTRTPQPTDAITWVFVQGHLPAINKILPSDNLFGVTGTAPTGGAGHGPHSALTP